MTTADQDLRAKLIEAIAFETGWEEGAENISDIVLSSIGPRLDQITSQRELDPAALEAACEAFNDSNQHITWRWQNKSEADKALLRNDMRKAIAVYLATLSDMGGAVPELADDN